MNIYAGNSQVAVWQVLGRPSAQQIIDILCRCWTYTNFPGGARLEMMRPMMISFSYRIRDDYPAIREFMEKMGIQCALRTKEQTSYWCDVKNTRLDGLNHLTCMCDSDKEESDDDII